MSLKDFPYDDMSKRQEMTLEGQFTLTEAEPAMDAASALRFGRDVFVQLDHVRSLIPFIGQDRGRTVSIQ